MGLISTLLSGAIFVGRVGQAIASAVVKTDTKTGVSLQASDIKLSGVTFFRSDAENGVMKTYAFNTTTDHIMTLALPTLPNGNAITYEIKPTQKVAIDDILVPKVAPDTEILVAPVFDTKNSDANDVDGSVIKVSLGNLTLSDGKIINIGGFSFEATLSGLVVTAVVGLGVMVYFHFRNRRGITARNAEAIEPLLMNSEGEDKKYQYSIDWKELGFSPDDELSGEVNIRASQKAHSLLYSNCTSPSMPLHEGELRLLGL